MKYLFSILILSILGSSCKEPEEKVAPKVETKEELLIKEHNAHPDSLIFTEDLIQYYRDNYEFDKAITEVDKAIIKDSTNPHLYSMKGILLFENSDTLGAVKAFEETVRLSPDPDYLISLGTLYAQSKNERALKIADILLQDFPKMNREAFFIKGFYYNYTNDKYKAINFFDKCIELSFTFMEAYREKAIALYDLKKYNEALEVLDKAVLIQNNYDEGYFYKGKTLEKLNRTDDAIDSYKRALMYDPEYIEAKKAITRLSENP
ncbi:MAG: tetratricopeptide repeat protein [Ferruginibacter sp.]